MQETLSQEIVVDNSYKYFLEKKLVNEFRKKFFEKLGYYPRVILQDELQIPVLPLTQLQSVIENIMWNKYPYMRNKSLSDPKRLEELVKFRKIFFFMGKQMGYTLKEMGNFLGSKDHSTVVHNITSAKNFLRNGNPSFTESYSEVFQTLVKFNKVHESN